MREYSRHKRMVKDVDKFMNDRENPDRLEKVMLFAMQYLSLRTVHSDEISNEEIGYAVQKVNTGQEFEINELYSALMKTLTKQEYIFRIIRVKYVHDTRDSLLLVASPLLKELGKYMHRDAIHFNRKEVKLLAKSDGINETEKEAGNDAESSAETSPPEEKWEPSQEGTVVLSPLERMHVSQEPEKEKEPIQAKPVMEKKLRTKRERHPDLALCETDPELDRINHLWDNPSGRDDWLMANVATKSNKYGYETAGKYDATTVGKAVGVDQGTVLFYLRQKLLAKA